MHSDFICDATTKTLTVGAGCEVALLARDGVWRTVAPKPLSTNSLDLTGASRADLAVRCSADSTISVNGSVVTRVYADATLPSNLTVEPYSNGATGTNWSELSAGPSGRDVGPTEKSFEQFDNIGLDILFTE